MATTSFLHIVIPFILTYAGPGILLAFLYLPKKEMDGVLFLIYAAIFGFFAQIAIAILLSITANALIGPQARVAIIGILTLGILARALYKKNGEGVTVRIGAYDIATCTITGILLLGIGREIHSLSIPYFNPATDQYYWFAYAEQSLYNPLSTLTKFFTTQLHRPIFFLTLAPYVAFLPKTILAYQELILAWTYANYALISLAITRLAYTALPVKNLGLLASPALFSLHWFNYYLISTATVPQNLGLFFFIAGFIIFMQKETPLSFLWIFLIIFYTTHLGTLTIFILIIGIATIFARGTDYVQKKMSGEVQPKKAWHLFEIISFLPTVAIIALYALYNLQILSFFDARFIFYYPEYIKNMTLWTQPYLDKEQNMIIVAGIIGACIAFIRQKNITLFFAFAVPWVLLTTPLLAYHAFYASWQPFRYYLFLYPSMVILGLYLVAQCIMLIRSLSRHAAIATSFIFVIVMAPVFILTAFEQQQLIFLDMITGRDAGARNETKRKEIQEFIAMGSLLPKNIYGSIIIDQDDAIYPYLSWVFSPRKIYIVKNACSETSCAVKDALTGTSYNFFDLDVQMIIVAKSTPERLVSEKVLAPFASRYESASFTGYAKL